MLAITNAKIFPIAAPPIERGTIVIRDGIIEAVGANVAVPSGAQVIDAAGAEVYPGFIDAQTTIGLEDPGAGSYGDANEILDFNPQLRAQVAFHNDSDAIPVARANGFTTVAVTPAGGLLGGQIRGDEPRRLDLGREHGGAVGRRHVPVPAARRRRTRRRRARRPSGRAHLSTT